jgi:hypothetical protein
MIIFGSVWFLYKKKVTKTGFLKKKLKPVQTDRFWFDSVILGKNWFKPLWLGFFGFRLIKPN